MSMWKKTMISLLAFSLVAGAGSAMAAPPAWANNDKNKQSKWEDRDDKDSKKNNNNKNNNSKNQGITIQINGSNIFLTLDDVRSESSWALQYITELIKKGVFTGYEDGTFRPNKPVTRIETITAAVRQMGLRDLAESAEEKASNLNFQDADLIKKKYPWAVGYVSVALENDLFLETENKVQPDKEADRLWATILLVKALGLEDEAKKKMDTELPFKDKKEIPAGSVGYVAVALEKGIITGYDDKTFKPNKPVTRAELAAILDRTGDQIPDSETGYGQVSGAFSGIVGGKVTILSNNKTTAYSVTQDVTVVRNNELVDLDDLVVGDTLSVVISNGSIIHISVTKAASVTDGQRTGTVTAVSSGKITVSKDGSTAELAVASDVVVVRNNQVAKYSDVKVGDQVTIVIAQGKVVHITVTTPVAESGSVNGTVTAVASGKLTITKDNKATELAVDNNVVVIRNGLLGKYSDLKVGDQVTAVIVLGKVVHVTVTTPAAENGQKTGTVTAVASGKLTITKDGATNVYSVDKDAVIIRGGVVARFSDVKVGDQVTVVLSNGVIVHVTVTQAVAESGQKTGAVTEVQSNKLTITKDNVATTYPVSSDVVVVRNNTLAKLSDLKVGDQVTVVISNGTIIHVSVTQAAVENGQIEGVVSAVYNDKISLTKGGTTTQYNVAADANIIRNDAAVSLSVLIPGDEVEAVVVNGTIIFLKVTDPVTDNNNAVYTVEGTYQSHRTENGKVVQISVTTQHDSGPVTRIYNVASDAVVNGNALLLEAGKSKVELIVVNQAVTVINVK